MHRLSTSFVLGYHGCDRSLAEAFVAGEPFKPSANDYDWLGGGVYFWESNPRRGLEFAGELRERRRGRADAIRDPAVVGAVIDLGFCLDLATSGGIGVLKESFRDYRRVMGEAGAELPRNRLGRDLLLRKLDCAVLNFVHESRARAGLQPFDSVRGVFVEGGRAFPGAGFHAKTHVQICVRDRTRIKGVFWPPGDERAVGLAA